MKLDPDLYDYAVAVAGINDDLTPLEDIFLRLKNHFKLPDEQIRAMIRIMYQRDYVQITLGVKKKKNGGEANGAPER